MKYTFIITFVIIYSSVIFCDERSPEQNIFEKIRDLRLLRAMVTSSFNHPSQIGYQSQDLGTEKHKYGYELKNQGKHFHFTSTEKDGVRLGCYGYELDGKKYLTQYVADTKGYRLVTTEDLIIVYPKSGRMGKTVFEKDADADLNGGDSTIRSAGVRYNFPKGCKGIDVQIDNSSRLRSFTETLRNFEISPRLPVNLPNRTENGDKYTQYMPSNSYPGPSHIYAPSNPVSNIPSQNTHDNSSASTSSQLSSSAIHANICEPSNESMNLCCEDSGAKLVIPIPIKNRNPKDCCSSTAKLILPLNNIDITIVAQLKENLAREEFDADKLIRSILENLYR